MVNYRLVMQLLLDGCSYREIHTRHQVSHSTTAKAKKALDDNKITTGQQLEGCSDDDLAAMIGDGRAATAGEFVTIDVDTAIKARTGRKKTPLNVLWANYLNQPAPEGLRHYSYERFRQLINREIQAQGLTTRVHHIPGHTCQVDWAGTTMQLIDPIRTKTTKVSIFVATLPYSGLVFAHGFLDQRQPNWLAAHRLTFDYFGGVPEVIVPDNASTASNAIATGDRARKVNTSYEEFLTHYNTAALPARPLRPKDKGNVESGVKVITNWAILKLATRDFTNLDDLNVALRGAVDVINDRIPFRDQPISRRQIFCDAERDLLAELPRQPFLPTQWKKSKVAPNWHITVATVHYSIPYTYVGDTVDVRIRGEQLDVFAGGITIATHQVMTQRGAYVTDTAHCPPGMEDPNNLWSAAYFLNQAARVGPNTRKAIDALLAAKPIVAQAYLPARNILGMGKGDNKIILEEACRRLVGEDDKPRSVSYTAVKNMMAAVRSDLSARPRTAAEVSPRPRGQNQRPQQHRSRGGLLGGANQFSLDALMGKEDQQ